MCDCVTVRVLASDPYRCVMVCAVCPKSIVDLIREKYTVEFAALITAAPSCRHMDDRSMGVGDANKQI